MRSFIGAVGGNVDVDFMDENYNTAHSASYEGVSPARVLSGITNFYDEGIKPKDNVSYSIAGERGAANLDAMEEASTRLDNLAVAREMESSGKDAIEIRLATGWERGADGKWRYEISDITLKDVQTWIGKRNIRLSDIVDDADELFTAYPELKDIKIKVGKSWSYGGAYNSGDNTIKVQAGALNPERIRETLVHEIQHAIQHQEGFARGGNSKMVVNESLFELAELWEDWRKRAIEWNSKPQSWKEGLTGQSVRAEIMAEKRRLSNLQKKNSLGSKGYHRLAGEVEARNVEERLNLTPEQRRVILLSETEDVARKDMIFLHNNLGESHMGSRVTKRMADIAKQLEGKKLTPAQQTVADVYMGKADNKAITFTAADGTVIKVVMRQGNEANAGTKHSIFRHYDTSIGYFTADDIRLIPEIIARGERVNKQRGKTSLAEYKMADSNGVQFTVLTQIDKGREIFNDFYSNKKALKSGVFNTQSALADNNNAFSTDKDTTTNPKNQISEQESHSLSRELADIESKAKADGTWLKAPNGKDTNLSPEQWVTVRTKAFKEWFGDWENDPENASKIVDENGEPKVVYHQTNATTFVNEEGKEFGELGWRERREWKDREDFEDYWEETDFYKFSRMNARTTMDFDGFFFAPEFDEDYGYGERTIEAFLNIRKPASYGDYTFDYSQNDAGQKERIRLQEEGYDGVINAYDGVIDEYVAFEPNQIKSATENIGTFDSANDDIRYSLNLDEFRNSQSEEALSTEEYAQVEAEATLVNNLQRCVIKYKKSLQILQAVSIKTKEQYLYCSERKGRD